MTPNRLAALRDAPFTYAEVGHTATTLPTGYRTIARTVTLSEETDFARAARDLLGWEVHRRAGLQVTSSGDVAPDAVVILGFALFRAPCRVVYVVDEPDRQGFAYGTLPGHPERGEEAFILERRDGAVTFTITAFSRPASLLARNPVAHLVQDMITSRYLRALP
ncbi:DUF1990 family protein [Actinokineospora sp. HUAS TT18]|uniref:DUF1990 family protein n=1 Tax=Actinokineospora sp. HUAS TT18 TaxID=3447451 RepID=UPI003F525E4D